MARPKKQTIDYFPHIVASGKTIFILENTFGNDGYAFWFKLLETLGSSDGHYYDCNNAADWRFLLAKTRINENTATEILKLLSELGAIDSELWKQNIIWVENLVHNVADVYKKRGTEIPKKPNFCNQKLIRSDVSGGENPQSKVKESKVKDSKADNTICASETRPESNKSFSLDTTHDSNIPGADPKEDAVPSQDAVPEPFVKVLDYFSDRSGVLMPDPRDIELAKTLAAEMSVDVIVKGIDESFRKYKPARQGQKIRTLRYCEGTIRDLWEKEKIKGDTKAYGEYRNSAAEDKLYSRGLDD